MRPGPATILAACVMALPACSDRPLSPGSASDGGDAGADAAADGAAGAAPGMVDWGVPIGSQPSAAAAGTTVVKAVIPTDDGGAVVAGSFTGSVAFAPDAVRDGTPGAGFVARYRSDQRLVWVHVLGADGGRVVIADMASLGDGEIAIAGWFDGTLVEARDADPIAVTSAGASDLFVARLASDGSVRWIRRSGGPGDDIARGVAIGTAAGAPSIAITGAVSEGAVFGPGEDVETRAPASAGPVFAARLRGDGSLVWARFAGGGVPGQGYGVAHDATGAVAVTGYVNGVAPFGNDAAGAPAAIAPAVGRAFVARWDVDGRLLWAQPLGGPAGEGDAIALAAGGAVIAVGLFEGEARFGAAASAPRLTADSPGRPGAYVAAFGPDGATTWARRLAGSGVRPWRLRARADGDLLLAATFGGGVILDPDGASPLGLASSGGTDGVFAALAGDGSVRWATAGGGPGDDQGSDFAAAADGAAWAVGTYFGPAAFGQGAAFGAGTAVRLDSGTDGASFLLRVLPP